jgi:hypothetical protein
MKVTITRKDGKSLGRVSALGGGEPGLWGVGVGDGYEGTHLTAMTFTKVTASQMKEIRQPQEARKSLQGWADLYRVRFDRESLSPRDHFARTGGRVPQYWYVVIPHDHSETPHLEYAPHQ